MNKPYLKTVFVALLLLAITFGIVLADSGGTLTPYTGEFGEQSCRTCHNTFALNASGGAIAVTGVPDRYAPGQTYHLTVKLSRANATRWGFQLIPRIASGTNMGKKAGQLTSVDASTYTGQWSYPAYLGVQVITQSPKGSLSSQAGTWTFDWTAPTSNIGDIRFSVAGVAGFDDASPFGDYVYTTGVTSVYASPPVEDSTGFAHIAIGGGYTTSFMLQNTGASAVNGSFEIFRSDGAALNARLVTGTIDTVAPVVPVSIQPGGMQLIVATAQNSADPTTSGWARVRSTGGTLSGVATFQYEQAGELQTTAGVMAAGVTQSATIPVDDDDSAARYTGYAVANPSAAGTAPITIRALLVPESGISGTRVTLSSISLAAGNQKAKFIIQDPATPRKFRGSLVLIGQNGASFAVTALVQNQGLISALPAIPSKASGIN